MYHHNIEYLINGHAVVRVLSKRKDIQTIWVGYDSSELSVITYFNDDGGYPQTHIYFVRDVDYPIYKVSSSVYNDGVLSIYLDIDSGARIMAPPTIMKA